MEISPTFTPPPPEPTATIHTRTATVLPVNTPTITPTIKGTARPDFPDPEQYEWQLIIGGLKRPVGVTNAGDGTDRLFVSEQSGTIMVIRDNNLLPEPFLDISELISCCGERGLLGLAIHPLDFPHPENCVGWALAGLPKKDRMLNQPVIGGPSAKDK